MTERPQPDQDAPGSEQTYSAAAEYAALADTPPSPDDERMAPTDTTNLTSELGETVQEQRAAQTEWLKRRDLLEDIPRLTMARREFELLKSVGLGDGGDATSDLIDRTRKNFGIPGDAQYVSVDIAPEEINLPHATTLVVARDNDFGTAVDAEVFESQGIGLEDIPRITMNEREAELFKTVGFNGGSASSLIKDARDLYGIPQDDQYSPQYALIDIQSDDPNQPSEPLLVVINEIDFGTKIDRYVIDDDYLNSDANPDSPLTPESGGAYRTVDISEAIARSREGLETFATELMKDRTDDPLSGSFWVRAGGIRDGQEDAYVWENSTPFKSAVELTVAFPHQYDSVCVVVGDRQAAANGKARMAQIKHPTVVLAIEGENLKRLQEVYRDLYHEPGFALTEAQRSERDALFNDHVVNLTSEAARGNKAREEDDAYRRSVRRQPQQRAREIPRS